MRLCNRRIVLTINGNRNVLRAVLISGIKSRRDHATLLSHVNRVFRYLYGINLFFVQLRISRFTGSVRSILLPFLEEGRFLCLIKRRRRASLIIILSDQRDRYHHGLHGSFFLRCVRKARIPTTQRISRRRRHRLPFFFRRLRM